MRNFTHNFTRNISANVAILVALLTPILLAAGGAAIETIEIYRARAIIQSATDAATLTAAKTLTLTGSQTQATARATHVFNSNLANLAPSAPSINFNYGSGDCVVDGVRANTTISHQLFLSQLWQGLGIGGGQSSIAVQSIVNCGGDTLEVVFVIDNSGSMLYGGRLQTAKIAANRLIDTAFNAFGNSSGQSVLKFALVPFSSMVNVGNQYKNASWADRFGASPIHHEHFDWTTIGGQFNGTIWQDTQGIALTRFRLYDSMRRAWKGCFESRPSPHHSLDTTPRQSQPETLFVPSFHPDPPDYSFNEPGFYFNNYILDTHNITPPGTRIENTAQYGTAPLQHQRQNWMWKYFRYPRIYDVDGFSGGSAVVDYINTDGGPNAFCSTQSLTALTNSQSRIKNAVANMVARGVTNIQQGVVWGWRVLSSKQPFDEGRNENITNNRKILILISDGQNDLPINSQGNNINPSQYGAFGFNGGQTLGMPLEKRLFTDVPNNVPNSQSFTDTLENNRAALDYHLAQTCENAKNDSVEIYAISFRIATSQTNVKNILRDCASKDENQNPLYFNADNNDALIDTFENIAERLIILTISG